MLEELLANFQMPSTAVLISVGVGVVCLWVGRMTRGVSANKREGTLKQEVLAAKSSVPQLESSLRNREEQVERLQEQVKDLNKDNSKLVQEREVAERDLRSAERQVKNLTSELNAVKGVSKEADNMVLDGFDDEVAHEAEDDSPLMVR